MDLDRSKAPEFHIPENFDLPDPVIQYTSSGLKVFCVSTPAVQAVKVEVISKSARIQLPLEKTLVPSFTLQLLTEGTSSKSEEELSEFFDFHASEVHPFSGFSQEGISLLTTKKHLEEVLPVFISLFSKAVFPEEKLEKKKSQRKISLKLEKEKNASRASQLFRTSLFGKSHPYGIEIEESHIDAIFREDLVEYFQKYLWNQAEVFISGDFSNEEFQLLLQSLDEIPFVLENISGPKPSDQKETVFREAKEHSVQTSIRFGNWSIPKNHPDYIPLTVFNTILGGYFGSRLIKNIREDKGHTYGIHSSLGEIDHYNYWVISADVQKAFQENVLQEIQKEILLLATEKVDESEIELVRNYLIGQMVGKFSSAFDLVDRFKSVHFSGLDFDFYRKQLEFFRTFTAEDILKIGKTYYLNRPFKEILVG